MRAKGREKGGGDGRARLASSEEKREAGRHGNADVIVRGIKEWVKRWFTKKGQTIQTVWLEIRPYTSHRWYVRTRALKPLRCGVRRVCRLPAETRGGGDDDNDDDDDGGSVRRFALAALWRGATHGGVTARRRLTASPATLPLLLRLLRAAPVEAAETAEAAASAAVLVGLLVSICEPSLLIITCSFLFACGGTMFDEDRHTPVVGISHATHVARRTAPKEDEETNSPSTCVSLAG